MIRGDQWAFGNIGIGACSVLLLGHVVGKAYSRQMAFCLVNTRL